MGTAKTKNIHRVLYSFKSIQSDVLSQEKISLIFFLGGGGGVQGHLKAVTVNKVFKQITISGIIMFYCFVTTPNIHCVALNANSLH